MNDGINLDLFGRPAKVGRPSNLALYRQYWRTEEIITTLPGTQVNCAEWFQLYGGYIVRRFSTGDPTEFFDIPDSMRTHIKDRLERITTSLNVRKGASEYNPADAQLARWFEPPEKPNLALQVPPLHLSGDQWERAVLLAGKLMQVARRRPYLVRNAVLGYCYAATTHRHVIVTDKKDAEYGELLFDLVKELHLGELAIRYVGFRAGSLQTDVQTLRKRLCLPLAKADYETTNNLDSPVRLNHVGIKLCWGDSHRASPAWHQVAVLGAQSCGAASAVPMASIGSSSGNTPEYGVLTVAKESARDPAENGNTGFQPSFEATDEAQMADSQPNSSSAWPCARVLPCAARRSESRVKFGWISGTWNTPTRPRRH